MIIIKILFFRFITDQCEEASHSRRGGIVLLGSDSRRICGGGKGWGEKANEGKNIHIRLQARLLQGETVGLCNTRDRSTKNIIYFQFSLINLGLL